MLWRAPWLKGRSSMLLLAVWDAFLITVLYLCTYRIRLGTWDTLGNNVFCIPIAWIACSYLVGRYSPNKNEDLSKLSDFAKSAGVGFAISAVLILHAWVAGIDDAGTRFRGFIIPFFSAVAVFSSFSKSVIYRKKENELESLLVCSQSEKEAIMGLNDFKKIDYRCSFVHDKRMLLSVGSRDKAYREIVIGKEIETTGELRPCLLDLRLKGVRILRLVDWCERYLHQIPPEFVAFEWLAIDEGFAIQPGRIGWRLKRLGDIIAASGLLILTLPLQFLTCLMIKIEDRGPILYRQTRTGLYGEKIDIVKFRSMKVNSERNGAVWAAHSDKRITRVGAVIRKFRIDELPQLVKVISGELSLIGPRPERPEIETNLRKILSNYDVRYWIKPGLTGWAQVSYPYGASVEDSYQKLSYDLFYVKNAGVLMDLLVVLKTIRLLVLGKGSIAQEVLRLGNPG